MKKLFLEADPQILVIQRLHPLYDGGKPIWSTPAVVRASGSTGSITINVFGIGKYFLNKTILDRVVRSCCKIIQVDVVLKRY